MLPTAPGSIAHQGRDTDVEFADAMRFVGLGSEFVDDNCVNGVLALLRCKMTLGSDSRRDR